MEFETLSVSVDGRTGRIELNRPDRLNAMTPEMLKELIEVARWFDEQTGVLTVVVSGAGRSFCAGYDLDAFDSTPASLIERRIHASLGGAMADAIEGMRAITVARLHGWVVGGGLVLAAACDLRVATRDTRFKIPEVELGIPLNWAGIPRLVREIGPALTKELVMTCREFSPDEAKAAGFLNRIVSSEDLDDEVHSLVERLVGMPAVPLLSTKDQVNAVTTAMAARIGHHMDGDGFLAVTSSPEFEKAKRAYRKRLDQKEE
ncbi:MAG: enoyl-CoA hydratase/isomerase family protein [Acidimicrobiia bacterium]